jgi:hypothetical protein
LENENHLLSEPTDWLGATHQQAFCANQGRERMRMLLSASTFGQYKADDEWDIKNVRKHLASGDFK